jgi:hypothetical protein
MNFFQPVFPLRLWTGRLAFVLVITLFVGTPLAMFFWMCRRKWM